MFIMIVSLSFSAVIYRVLTLELGRFDRTQRLRIERRLSESDFFPGEPPPFTIPLNPELVQEIRHRILVALAIVNASIFLGSAGLGYLLAGRTLRPIQDMVSEQNRFISDASHELRTPLTSLKSAFEVYLRNKNRTAKEADSVVSESIAEVNKLQSLSESLLTLAHYQHTTFETVQLADIIHEALKNIEAQAQKKHISIIYTPKRIAMKGNAYALTDLVTILLDNAVKYSPAKTAITIETKKTDGTVIIAVKDQGYGIAKKDLPHIFDRFYRADSARSKSGTGGYGLGLAIAKQIVEAHKGTISVESDPGRGSTFQLIFR